MAPKKSLARQAGWVASLNVAPISSRSGDDAMAALVDSMAAVAASAPLVAAEQAGSSAVGAAPPAKGRVSPVEVVVTAPSQDQPGAATVVLEGVVQSAPPGAQVDPPVALEVA